MKGAKSAPFASTSYIIAVDSERITDSERQAWISKHEHLWRRAHAIVQGRPDLDVSGVYHVLCNLERTPEERLRKGLMRGRLRTD